ncbi:MAG: hypothetical protein ACTSUE_13110, partial [Promethearchaeota archaeon]
EYQDMQKKNRSKSKTEDEEEEDEEDDENPYVWLLMPVNFDLREMEMMNNGRFMEVEEYRKHNKKKGKVLHHGIIFIDLVFRETFFCESGGYTNAAQVFEKAILAWTSSPCFRRDIDKFADDQDAPNYKGVEHLPNGFQLEMLCGYYVCLFADLLIRGIASPKELKTAKQCTDAYIKKSFHKTVAERISVMKNSK